MSYIIGKIKNVIYHNEASNYLVAIFRISEISSGIKEEKIKKSVTIAGNFLDYKLETLMKLEGTFINHERYGEQFKCEGYEYVMPKENDDIKEFLSSSFIKGCGKKTAEKIVELYGEKSIDIIKENKFALDKVEGISESKRDKIYESIMNYSKSSDIILRLKNLGFSIEESGKIYTKYKDRIEDILNNNIYLLNEIVEFKRLDNIFLNSGEDKLDKRRVKACIIESMKMISNAKGDIYYDKSEVYSILQKLFNINIDYETYLEYLDELNEEMLIVTIDNKCYLQTNYQDEIIISEYLKKIDNKEIKE